MSNPNETLALNVVAALLVSISLMMAVKEHLRAFESDRTVTAYRSSMEAQLRTRGIIDSAFVCKEKR